MTPEAIITFYLAFWLALAGAVLGSFLDCAVSRWAVGERPFRGRSHCCACGHTLAARDLIPVLSFALSRGKCRFCGAKIPVECLMAELAGAGALVCFGLRFGPSLELGQWLVFGAVLLALSLTDVAKRIIPDRLLLVLVANRAVWFFLLGQEAGLAVWLRACAVPAALLALVLAAERLLEREVMGGGDLKLLFVFALYLSWAEQLLTLLAGCLLGLVWAAAQGKREPLPFGPFLAAGAVLVVSFGGPLIQWYLGLF